MKELHLPFELTTRQRIHRTTVVVGEIREGLSSLLRRWAGITPRARQLFQLLQPREETQCSGQTNTG